MWDFNCSSKTNQTKSIGWIKILIKIIIVGRITLETGLQFVQDVTAKSLAFVEEMDSTD